MILPRVKMRKDKEGVFQNIIRYYGKSEFSENAINLIKHFSPDIKCEKDSNPNFFLTKDNFEVKGTYKLTVSESEICICYSDYEGVRNAISTLVQLRVGDGIKCVEIFDKPDNTFRSCMLDLARGYVEIDVLKEHIIRMAMLKFSHIHLHLMDRQSYVLESDVVPNPDKHRLYTKKEMAELIAFCKNLSLEVIPEIEIPAHAVNQIKALPELGCDIIDKKKAIDAIKNLDNPRKREFTDNKKGVSSWVVCAGKETTYVIFEEIIKEVLEIFDGPYMHIGGDELEFTHLGAHPHWDNCSYCTKKMEEENISDLRGLYYYVIRRVYDTVKSLGRKMIMWNDQIDVFNPIDIPKDIIIEFWNGNVITKERGTYQKLLEQGFETINAECHYCYVDFPQYMREEKITRWNTHKEYVGDSKLDGKIIGGEMCAWELGNPLYSFYPYSLPVCMTLFADRVWNNDIFIYDDEYKRSAFSVMVGVYDRNINPFSFFKEFIPPRDRNKNMLEDIELDSISLDELSGELSKMNKIKVQSVYGKNTLDAYIGCLEDIENILK